MTAALYSRVSTAEQAEHGYSIDEQISRMKSYCQAMGWTIGKVYTDAGQSGASIDRPALQMLIEDVKAGAVDTVLVYKLDRLSRSQKDALYLIEDVFLKSNVNFVSISENFDTSTALGRAMIGILAVFAQLEREQIRERMSLGKEARIKSGKWHGAAWTPVGYDYTPGSDTVTVNEYEAVYVRKIFSWFNQGLPIRSIARELEGIRHKYGNYDEQAIRSILRNPIYIGMVRHKGKSYPGIHQPIIDKETFDKANAILDTHHEVWAANVRSGHHPSLLTGLLFCARCGARYHTVKWSPKSKPVYSCYSRDKKMVKMIKDRNCKNDYWNVSELDELILDEVKKVSVDPAAMAAVFRQDPEPEPDNKKALEKQLAKLRRERSKYMDLYALDSMDIESVREKIEPLNSQISALEGALVSLQKPPSKRAEFTSVLTDAAGILEAGTREEQRDLLLSIISRIDLDGPEVSIHWKL